MPVVTMLSLVFRLGRRNAPHSGKVALINANANEPGRDIAGSGHGVNESAVITEVDPWSRDVCPLLQFLINNQSRHIGSEIARGTSNDDDRQSPN